MGALQSRLGGTDLIQEVGLREFQKPINAQPGV